MQTTFQLQKLDRRDQLGDVNIGERIILKSKSQTGCEDADQSFNGRCTQSSVRLQ